jgi:hypothetical protein
LILHCAIRLPIVPQYLVILFKIISTNVWRIAAGGRHVN